ncbi:MAG: DUF805 domain-containing protein [Devosiaceae bacterium]
MNDAVWYYASGSDQRGPVGEADLSALIGRGEIGPDTLVWREGMANWSAARASLPGGLIPQSWVDGLSSPGSQPPPAFGGQGAQASAAQAGAGSWDGSYYHPTQFVDAVKTVILGRYAQFSGRARRREYWWWILFYLLASLVCYFIDAILFSQRLAEIGVLSNIFALAVLVPAIAVTARRLHDIGRSGWWQLISLIPLIGWAVMIWWLTRPSEHGDNQYGPA